jgi:hypothetical protein
MVRLRRLAVLLLSFTVPAWAGEPVEDVDVTVEQVPGAGVFVEVTSGVPFDRLVLSGSRAFVNGLEPERLPAGWVLTREGRRVVLSGPALTAPVRFRLRAAERPRSVDWDVSFSGKDLGSRRDVVPRSVPPFVVKNSLQGVVYLPPDVAPGETIALRGVPGAELPPGGRFVISGVVSEPIPAADLPTSPASGPRWAGPPAQGLEITGGDCDTLSPLAASLFASGNDPGAVLKSYYESRSNTAKASASAAPRSEHTPLSQVMKLRHDTSKQIIQNIRRAYLVAPSTGRTGGRGWSVALPGQGPESVAVEEAPMTGPATRVAFETTATADGCRFTPREPDLVDLARAQKAAPPRDRPAEGKPSPPGIADGDEPVHAVSIPDDLRPGDRLTVRYLDRFGDPWLDVPAADTEIVPARPADEPAPAPCVRAATAYVQAEDAVCVCGDFPTTQSQLGVWVDERSAGVPLSLSRKTLHFTLPAHALALGKHVWSGDPAAGFAAPGTAGFCRAFSQVIAIRGEVDAALLMRGGSTPMRLTVTGTTDRLAIRIKNLTPAILRIDGGDEQVLETSGGNPNQVTRTVHGTGAGTFNVEWKLEAEACPCGE